MVGTELRYNDLFGAVAKTVDDSLSVSQELRVDGLEYQGSTVAQWVYLTVEFTSQSRTGGFAPAEGQAILECYTRASTSSFIENATLMEDLRRALQDANVLVYGKASGSASTLRGVIQFTDISVQQLGTTEGVHVGQLTASFLGRN